MAKNVIRNPTRALGLTANIATAVASRNPKKGMSTLAELLIFYNTGKELYLGKFVPIMLYKWNTKQIAYIPPHPFKKLISNKN